MRCEWQLCACWPQVLAVSKQVHGEAKDIVHAENTAVVDYSIDAASFVTGAPRARDMKSKLVMGNQKGFHSIFGEAALEKFRLTSCPAYFRRLQHLSINLNVDLSSPVESETRENAAKLINHLIHALSDTLSTSHSLKRITLNFSGVAHTVEEKHIALIICPLAKLGLPASNLSLMESHNIASDSWQAKWQAATRPPVASLLVDFESLHGQIDRFDRVTYEIAGASADEVSGGFFDLADEMWDAMSLSESMTQVREDDLKKSYRNIEDWLRGKGSDDLEKAVKLEMEILMKIRL